MGGYDERKIILFSNGVQHIHQLGEILVRINILFAVRAHHKELPFHRPKRPNTSEASIRPVMGKYLIHRTARLDHHLRRLAPLVGDIHAQLNCKSD